jgi:hypothetical protein
MYLRFVVNTKDQDSGRRLGLFHVIRELCEAKLVSAFEEQQLLTIRDWYMKILRGPMRLQGLENHMRKVPR